jgi:hypothetical protein
VQFPFWRFPVVRRFLGDYRPSLLRLSPAISGGHERFRRFRTVLASFRQLFWRSVVLGVSSLHNFLWRRQLRFGYSCNVRVLAVGVVSGRVLHSFDERTCPLVGYYEVAKSCSHPEKEACP